MPTATTFRVLPVGALEERRKRLNAALQAAGRPGKISFTHLIAFALVQATKQHPVMGHTLVRARRRAVPGAARGHRASASRWTSSVRTGAAAWWCR